MGLKRLALPRLEEEPVSVGFQGTELADTRVRAEVKGCIPNVSDVLKFHEYQVSIPPESGFKVGIVGPVADDVPIIIER